MGTQRPVVPPSDGTGPILLHRGVLPAVGRRRGGDRGYSTRLGTMPKGESPDCFGRPQRQHTQPPNRQRHGCYGAGRSHGYSGYVPTISPATSDMGKGEMDMADAEKGTMDLLPTRLYSGNGQGTPPNLQLCDANFEPSQVRPSSNDRNDQGRGQQATPEIPTATAPIPHSATSSRTSDRTR